MKAETTEKVAKATANTTTFGLRNPFGCTFWMLDAIAVIYVLLHLGQTWEQIGRLIRMIP